VAISPTFFPYISRCGLYWVYIPRFVQLRLIGVGILHKIKLDIVPTLASETNEKVVAGTNSSQRGDLSGVFSRGAVGAYDRFSMF